MTSKEDIFITELFKVGVGVCSIDDTDYLKKVCAKSAKVKNIVENLKGSSASTIVKDLMLAQCYQINLNYEEFLSNPKLVDRCLLYHSQCWRKEYDSKKTNNSKKVNDSNQANNLKIFYKDIYSLYDSQDTSWLKELVDLKVLMEEMNKEVNKYICPICQAQLDGSFEKDHFLPRSIFPTLTISSLNFTPICATCNSASYKGESAPKLPVIIPNKCNPIEEYITFRLVRRNDSDFDVLKEELEKFKVEVDSNMQMLCDVIPEGGLSEVQAEQVINLINLFKLKKRFNQREVPRKLTGDQEEIIRRSKCNIEQRKVDSLEGIEQVIREEVNTHIRELCEENINHPYRKYRRMMLDYYFNEAIIKDYAKQIYFEVTKA
ncbi:HNH endonuclease [Streptococcus cristatus]|uniref:HNH endonuclease signature motif containing protein n=1 Tax=Streptococcus cristatus TaxID=45634 RepID=UPI0039C43CDC